MKSPQMERKNIPSTASSLPCNDEMISKPKTSIAQGHAEDSYLIVEENFAKGSYGKIVLAKEANTGKEVVIKKIDTKVPSKLVLNEVRAGRLLENEHIAKFQQYHLTARTHYLVFERIKGCDLYSLMEVGNFAPLSEHEAQFLFMQLLSAVEYAHSFGVAHRDIKLENIMVDRTQHLTLIDFGLCSIIDIKSLKEHHDQTPCSVLCEGEWEDRDSHLSRDYVGSDNYVPPEIAKKLPYCAFKADVWCMGIVLYSLLHGQFPWDNEERMKLLISGKTHPKLVIPNSGNVSQSARHILRRMLDPNPATRISLKELTEHPWFYSATL